MTTTPIRNLVLMLDTVRNRQEAVDLANSRHDLSDAEWPEASRVWSRQQQALSQAIVAEPPLNFDDVLAVLVNLDGWHDLIVGQGDEATARELRDLQEMTGVAVKNCIVRLAAMFRPDAEPTDAQHDDLVCIGKQVQHWLPVTPAGCREEEGR